MTVEEKVSRAKMSLLDLAEYLKNISEACRITGVSRQHFYDLKQAYEEEGLDGLREKSRRKPCLRNRVSEEIESAVVKMAEEYPAYGQQRASNELRIQGIFISPYGVRNVWKRHDLETFKKRLRLLEEKSAREGIVYTEAQLQALERRKLERENDPDEIETHHPGYLLSQDTYYVGYIKGVGRIYQQSGIDTYSSLGFGKLYNQKVGVTAADLLNDRVLPFFEEQGIPVLRVLTDRGTEYCGCPETHPYELFLGLNEIEHTKTKVRNPQTNGICERFHQTILNEFYRVALRKKFYNSLESLQADLDEYLVFYNTKRTHQGKRCQGRTPMRTFIDGKKEAEKKNLTATVDMAQPAA